MKGNRIQPDADGYLRADFQPGDFGRASPVEHREHQSPDWREWWVVRAPNGHTGTLNPKIHTVTEHEDGSITVHPSIVISGDHEVELYHGWLEHGTWRNA